MSHDLQSFSPWTSKFWNLPAVSPSLAILILADPSGLILGDVPILLTVLVLLSLRGLNLQLGALRECGKGSEPRTGSESQPSHLLCADLSFCIFHSKI